MPKTSFRINPSINPELIAAAGLIRQGRLVAFPTETVYGLGANALDPRAVERIFQAKGRPHTSPLIVHVSSIEMAKALVTTWPDKADRLARAFWPGPLTLVLPKQPQVPDIVTAGLPSVGIRMPNHLVALALIAEAGVPIAAPSANRFTELSPTTAGHVRQSLGAAVACILDGGPTQVGIESTVLSLAGEQPLQLRPGMISREQIESIVGKIALATAAPDGAHPSPGMHERHYSPRTPLILGDPPTEGRGAYLWRTRELPAASKVRMPPEPAEYAAVLYSKLHQLDEVGLDWIAVESPPTDPDWAAIRDRLRRAVGASALDG